MKKIILSIATLALFLFACKKDDADTTKTVQLNETFAIKVNQAAELASEDWKITLLEITEESRCPTTVECFTAGRAVAEFKIEKGGETLMMSASTLPLIDALFSDSFTAFGHLVKLVEVTPYPEDFTTIPQKDYSVKIEVE